MSKGTAKSFRLPPSQVEWLKNTSKAKGITQTDLLSECISNYSIPAVKSKSFPNDLTSNHEEQDDETIQMLASLGVGTLSGVAGYHIAGWLRQQFEMDEDKGIQTITGLVVGLTSIFIREKYRKS
jgi:hypothetical protein